MARKNSDYAGLPNPVNFDHELWLNADLNAELDFDTAEERDKAREQRGKMHEQKQKPSRQLREP